MSHTEPESEDLERDVLERAGRIILRRSSPLLKPLPTARIAFPKQQALLRAYASLYDQVREPVANAQAAAVVDMSAGTVSLANAFFSDTGLLVRQEGGYVPSPQVSDFHRQWSWDENKAGHELYPLLANAWFGHALLPKLSVAGSMSEDDAVSELAKIANATPEYRSQLLTLLDYLELGGVVEREGGMVRLVPRDFVPPPPSGEREGERKEPPPSPPPPEVRSHHPFVAGLIASLPEPGETWPDEKRDEWIDAARASFNLMYKRPPSDSEPRVTLTPAGEG